MDASADAREAFKRAVGLTIGILDVELLGLIRKLHPDLGE